MVLAVEVNKSKVRKPLFFIWQVVDEVCRRKLDLEQSIRHIDRVDFKWQELSICYVNGAVQTESYDGVACKNLYSDDEMKHNLWRIIDSDDRVLYEG